MKINPVIRLIKEIPKVTLIYLLFFGMTFAQNVTGSNSDYNNVNTKVVYGMINRILPGEAGNFIIETIEADSGNDVFEIESSYGKIVLKGNNGVSIASAFNYYLKNFAHCDVSWNGSNLKVPHPLPVVPGVIHKTSPYKYRYYFNYCTFNYTASWWDWKRWQREIDFMALNGINMPLSLTGQNIIWERVYKSMGFTEKDLQDFFSGPAYFSWFWMGNLDGYGGPLPIDWMKSHETLEKKILEREREYGMSPVLPSFSGHVPPSFKEKFPNSRLIKTNWDAGFNDTYCIAPEDTMFTYIGKKFMTELIKTYGTNHLYSSDTFNENVPPDNDSTFLNGIGKKVYQSMVDVDPKAVWVMQGWLFYNDSKFWKTPQIQALLGAVPNDKMIILDLWSEVNPVWNRTDAYYGKPWIWCMLHNFGGNINMFGNMNELAVGPANALHDKESGNMVGIGITAEGIEQNPAVYELMLDNSWRNEPIDLHNWINQYAFRRYGMKNAQTEDAWEILLKTVYNSKSLYDRASTITERPEFGLRTSITFSDSSYPYNAANLLPAWRDFISTADNFKNSEGFKYDLVDVSRQVLANYGDYLYQKMQAAYKEKNLNDFEKISNQYLTIISDIDKLLSTQKDFLLGKWINSVKSWATSANERELYERNARDLVTLWGNKYSPLHDYAEKQWAGLLKDFYKHRWELFLRSVIRDMKQNIDFNQKDFDAKVQDWEWKWVNSRNSFAATPKGDPVGVSKQMYKKYYPEISLINKPK